jgi:translation elongation factor EF-1alpha
METQIGQVTHFYNGISVAVLSLTDTLEIGDKIHILGHTTDFIQNITSMEINHKKVTSVSPGDDIALKVNEPVRNGDTVYKISA